VVAGKNLTNGRNLHATSIISGSLGALTYQLFLSTATIDEGRNERKLRTTVMEGPLGKNNAPNLYALSLKPAQSQAWWHSL
jgi:hypothetical protein